jgi:hypothetical protein
MEAPSRPGEIETLDQETLKRIYDEHIDEKETVSRKQLLEEGLRKLKAPAPQ